MVISLLLFLILCEDNIFSDGSSGTFDILNSVLFGGLIFIFFIPSIIVSFFTKSEKIKLVLVYIMIILVIIVVGHGIVIPYMNLK